MQPEDVELAASIVPDPSNQAGNCTLLQRCPTRPARQAAPTGRAALAAFAH